MDPHRPSFRAHCRPPTGSPTCRPFVNVWAPPRTRDHSSTAPDRALPLLPRGLPAHITHRNRHCRSSCRSPSHSLLRRWLRSPAYPYPSSSDYPHRPISCSSQVLCILPACISALASGVIPAPGGTPPTYSSRGTTHLGFGPLPGLLQRPARFRSLAQLPGPSQKYVSVGYPAASPGKAHRGLGSGHLSLFSARDGQKGLTQCT